MTTDRELLELAAKAAGVDGRWADFPGMDIRVGYQGGIHDGDDYWNPLIDDGDALRLAVQLNLTVYCFKDGAQVMLPGIDMHKVSEKNTDIHAATRRAIVRAAAEIGRTEND